MAGLLGNITGAASSGLLGFLTGKTIASSGGAVDQFRNNLRYDYSDILNGVLDSGVLFDVRVNDRFDYEYGRNLSRRGSLPNGLLDVGDTYAMAAGSVAERFQMQDVAKVAYGLLLAAKGEISEQELNLNPAFASLTSLSREDAFDRLNIDTNARFRVNGAEFEFFGDDIRVNSIPGQGTTNRTERADPELAKRQRTLESKAQTLGGLEDVARVSVAGGSVNEMIAAREELEGTYTFVAYDFTKEEFVASNNFKDISGTLAQVPDALFFGANLAMQLEVAVGDAISPAAKNEIFPTAVNYFASLVLGALTGLPTQLEEEFEFHAGTQLMGLYNGDLQKANQVLDAIAPKFQEAVFNVVEAVSEIPLGADLETLRAGLGVSFSGATYSVQKFVLP